MSEACQAYPKMEYNNALCIYGKMVRFYRGIAWEDVTDIVVFDNLSINLIIIFRIRDNLATLVSRTRPLRKGRRKEGSGDHVQRVVLVPENQAQPISFKILNLLLSNAILAARARMTSHANFAVVRDVLCNYCIPREWLNVRMVTRLLFPPSLPFLRGLARETTRYPWLSFVCMSNTLALGTRIKLSITSMEM